jgi:flagellar export protein FliJ
MPKYQFRLETLHKLRVARRDQERASLADAFRAEQILAEHHAAVAAEKVELRKLRHSATAGRYVDVNRLLEAQRYDLVLKTREAELTRQAELLAIETERRRQAVVEADREVRVLELLDERRRREHRRQQQRAEIKELDEAALLRRERDGTVHQS